MTAPCWPTVECGLDGCTNRLRMRTIGSDENGRGGRPDYDGVMGKDDQFCSREHRDKAEREPDPAALVQVGWMLSPDLAAEFGATPLSDDYLITLEQAEQDGGVKDEYADRVIPIYRKADDA